MLSQHDLLHRDMQKSLDLFAIVKVSRRNLGKIKKIGKCRNLWY